MLPAEVSHVACQPPILIFVGTFQSSFAAGKGIAPCMPAHHPNCVHTFQPSCAASRGMRPCMPAPHPNLCGYLPTIMCGQLGYHTLHASAPSEIVWVPSNHPVLPAKVSDLACQPPILICVGAFQPSFAASRGITPCMPAPDPDFSVQIPSTFRFRRRCKPCMQYRRHLRKTARLLDLRAQFPSTISKCPLVPEHRPTLHAISRALPQPWTTPKFPSTSRTWSTMGHHFWPNQFGLEP